MLDRPDGSELLAVARQTLLERIVPALPEDLRYDALMVANAIAIAAREMNQTSQAIDREREALAALLGAAGQDLDLAGLRRALGRRIREGAFDDARLHEVRAVLWDSVAARVAISNPKLLSAAR